MKTKKFKQILLGLILPVLIIAAWVNATHFGHLPTSILPKISMVWQAFLEMLQSGQLWNDLSITLSRVVKGYLFSALLGILLGSLMGMSKTIAALLLPTVTVIRQIPIIAWIPLIILWCGIGELSKVVVIVMAAFFPIVMNTMSGISSTPAGYIEVAQLYKIKLFQDVSESLSAPRSSTNSGRFEVGTGRFLDGSRCSRIDCFAVWDWLPYEQCQKSDAVRCCHCVHDCHRFGWHSHG